MANDAFIVDRKLGAVPVARLLEVRATLRADAVVNLQTSITADRPILTGGQTLQPDTLYPSGRSDPLILYVPLSYYLPSYRLSVGESGRPAVELRFSAGDAGEVGRLTLILTWAVPITTQDRVVRAMDHVAALSLKYRVAVQSGGSAASMNASSSEQILPLQPLQQLGNQQARSTTVFTDKAQFDTVYQAMREPDQGASLDVRITARVGVRTWRQILVGSPAAQDQAAVLQNRRVLFTQMLHAESLATLRPGSATASARVKLAAPPPEVASRVETTRVALANPESARLMTARGAAPSMAASPVMTRTTVAEPMAVRVQAVDAARIARTDTATPRVTSPAMEPTVFTAPQQETGATLTRVNTPQLARAVSRSDLDIAGRQAVPIRVALGMDQEPAIIESDLENLQNLPFSFDHGKPEHGDVFAVEGFVRGGIHLLLARTLVKPDGSSHIVYQDNLMRDVVHMAPSGFRLDRDATAPFLPAISFLAGEFTTTDNDRNAEVLFRVAAVYRLEPWFDPDVVELAREQIAAEGFIARFTTAVPHDATLSLALDLLGNEQDRKAATIDPATGITDTLDLDHDTFVRLWRERLANPSSGGVGGRVDYKLFDGSQAQVPVNLSLWETSAELFDVAYLGPVPEHPGRYRVQVRNRVESPARITALPGEVVMGGVARAVDPAAILGQILQPEQARQIDYELAANAGPIVSFEPTVLGRAEPNLPALLKLLLVTPGYTALGFSLTVKAAAGTFAPPAGEAEPLTGLLIEFDDGTRVTLSPNVEQAEVTLVGRLTDQILGTADDSQRYFYRVTNLHASGEGARTSWLEGHGTSALEVGTAVVRLDF